MSTETPVVIDSVNAGDFGTYNLGNGPYFAELDIWNPVTADYSGLSFTAGSTTVTGFSSTAGILPGMTIYSWPDTIDTPWPTVVSVGTNSIVMSAPSSGTFTDENTVEFGLANNGVMYDETITSYASTFPNGTTFTWSFPDQPNNAHVYAYPNITYGSDPYYPTSTNTVAPLQAGSIHELSVTYNVSVNAGVNTYDCLIETWATSTPDPIGSSSFTNEIGFLAYTPTYLESYILSLPNHFDFSFDGFNAYIATRPGTAGTSDPPYTLIMPVTAPDGTTPLEMTSGTYTVQLGSIIAALITDGILSPSSYINEYQFGFEIAQGSGSATINSLSYDWNNSTPIILPPTITSYSPDSGTIGDGITNATTLTLTGTAAAGTTVTVFDGTTQLGTATVNAGGAWSLTTGTLANGTHSFTATDIDTAGDISAASAALTVTVDTVAPNAPVIASDTVINTNEVNLTGTAEANSTVVVFDGTTLLGTAAVDASGAWSFTTGALADGSHAFTATDTDAAGNTSLASQAVDPTIVPPAAPTIASFSPDTGKVGDGITDAAVLTLTGTAEANSTVAVFDGKMELGTATVNSSGAWSFTTGTLANGTHTFTTTDSDAAGTSAASSALAVTVDTTPPNPAFNNLVHNSNGTVTLSGTSEANSTVSIYDGTTDLGTVTTAANGTWSFTTSKLSTAVQSFTLKAVDVAGNVGSGTNAALYGPASHETINVGPANDLVTVLGGSDTFVFGSRLGSDVVTGFQATGSSHDILQFSHNTFSSFAAVLAHAAQVGSNVVITADAADTVTLANVHLSNLQKNDIHIV